MSTTSHKDRKIALKPSLLHLILLVVVLVNLIYALPPRNEFQVILHNPTLNYAQRLRLKLGSPLFEYIQFLNKNIPQSATVALPPDTPTWDLYGNVLYMQYFLYPRRITTLENADYALVVRSRIDQSLWPFSKLSATQVSYLQTSPELGVIKLR